MIAYKVVEKQTRWGSNWMMFKDYLADKEISRLVLVYRIGLNFRKKNPEFFPRYFRGSVVKAAPKSKGILCFETKQHAENFISDFFLKHRATVVKVQGIGRARRIDSVIRGCGAVPWHLVTKKGDALYMMPPPKGTIAFNAVKVLE